MENKRKALIVSISDYNDESFPQLNFCNNDGEEMYNTLTELGYEILGNQKIVGKSDEKTMRNALIDFFQDESVRPSDTLLFYFSGHGVLDGFGGRYFANTEVSRKTPERDGIPFEMLNQQMSKSIAGKKIAILDCCFSGGAAPNLLGMGGDDIEKEAEDLGSENLHKAFDKGQGSCILASSLSNSRSYALPGDKYSAFTRFIIEGLKGTKDSVDKYGFVTPNTLSNYAFAEIQKIPELGNQKPVKNISYAGELILAEHKHLRTSTLSSKELADIKSVNSQDLLLARFSKLGDQPLERVFEEDPKDAYAMETVGIALLTLHKYTDAIHWFDKALEIEPKYVPVLNFKGFSLTRLHKYTDAIHWFDKALKIDPKYVDALYNKGVTLIHLHKYTDAITWFDKALEINPKDFNTLFNKGFALGGSGKYEETIRCYDKVLEIDPKHVSALYNKGYALDVLGKYAEAIRWFDKALKIDPKNIKVLKIKKEVQKKDEQTSPNKKIKKIWNFFKE